MPGSLFHGDMVQSDRILYTPSNFARENLIYLQEIGHLQAKQPHTSRRSGLSSYLFFVVAEGTGSLEYGGQRYSLQKGDCVFLDCSLPYSHRCSPQLWQLVWAHFAGANMAGIYRKYQERGGGPVLHPENIDRYTERLERLYSIAAGQTYTRDMQLFEQLTGLLALLMEDCWQPTGQVQAPIRRLDISRVRAWLDDHYTEKITLDGLAEHFYINKFYLTRMFKAEYGTSITGCLQELRITRAKELLRFSDASVEEVGARCGIPDPNYFARLFKRVEGISPMEYRKQW